MNFDELKKNLINKGKEIINNVDTDKIDIIKDGINIIASTDAIKNIQEAIKVISPIELELKDSINEKAIVINQEELNKYLKSNLIDIKELESANINICDDNIFEVILTSKKFLINTEIKQKFKINSFTLTPEEGIVNLEFIDKLNIEGSNFISKIVLLMIKFILISSINDKFIAIIDKTPNIEINNNSISINLKDGIMNKFYGLSLNEAVKREIPIVGAKKLIEVINITNLRTKDKKLIIDFKIKIM